MLDRLEHVLERHLGRTNAPEELWDRIQRPPEPGSWSPRQGMVWALATAVLLLAAFWGLNARGERVELRSADTAQIREWINTATGLDVPLPAKTPPSVRLICARVVNGDAEIDYRAGNRDATLLVSRVGSASSGDAGHRFLRGDLGVTIWTMGSQLYTLSGASGDSRAACTLCHG